MWLAQHAAPIADIPALTRNAQVIGLGDATHGTHEFFDVKRRLIPMLAPAVLAFEAPYAEWQGSDPAAFIQSSDYFFWDAQEVLDTIEWARSAGVKVVGVDCAHPFPAIAMVTAYSPAAATDYSCLTTFEKRPALYPSQTPQFQKQCRESIALVRPMLESSGAPANIVRAARVVEQGEVALATMNSNRDACMAENIEWLASQSPRVVFWGHNEHLGKTPYGAVTSTGTILARDLRYYAIGTIALNGSYWAYQGNVIDEVQLPPPSDDDYATFFARAARPEFFVSLAGALPPFLRSPHPIRLGGTTGGGTVTEDLPARFDGIIFIETSTPSQLRHFPTRVGSHL